MTNPIRFFELNTGAKIPSVGLGTYQVEPCAIAKTITTAIKVGYRHIDCASLYTNQAEGMSSTGTHVRSPVVEQSIAKLTEHKLIGSALKKLFEDGVVKREDLWITSKLWCTDHDPKDVPKALDKTLKDLQLDYLDLYLIHWPVSMKKGSSAFQPENLVQPEIPNTWRAMEALYDSGKARAIGVSNFSSKKLQDLLDIARVPPAVNQVELNPGWQQPKLHALCESKGVHLSGYSPLGSPRLSSNNILKSQVVKRVAEKLGKTPAQVALRWGLQVGHSVLTKSINETRIKENFDVFDWSIPEDMIAMFSEIKQDRLIKGTFAVNETYGAYKTIEDLWDDEV